MTLALSRNTNCNFYIFQNFSKSLQNWEKIEKLGVTLDFKAPLLEFEDRRHSLLSEFHALMMYQTVHFKAKCKERLAKCRLKKFYALNFFSRQKWRSLSPSFVDEFFGEFLKGATRCGFLNRPPLTQISLKVADEKV